MKNIFYILTLSVLSACTRKVSKAVQKETYKSEYATQSRDTFAATWKTVSTNQIYFGDTLRGSMFFPISNYTPTIDTLSDAGVILIPVEDSIESNGQKIKVGILPSNGGIKLQIKAISKPVTAQQTTVSEGTQNQGSEAKAAATVIATSEQTQKQTSTSYAGLVKGLVVFLILLSGIFLTAKKFNLWQRLKNLLK